MDFFNAGLSRPALCKCPEMLYYAQMAGNKAIVMFEQVFTQGAV